MINSLDSLLGATPANGLEASVAANPFTHLTIWRWDSNPLDD